MSTRYADTITASRRDRLTGDTTTTERNYLIAVEPTAHNNNNPFVLQSLLSMLQHRRSYVKIPGEDSYERV